MRFLIVNTDYAAFLSAFYAGHTDLEAKSFATQMDARMSTLFGVADFYSRNLRTLGHEAVDVHANNLPAQSAWAREHGFRPERPRKRLRLRRGFVPWWGEGTQRWLLDVLAAQVRYYRPDVILNQALDEVSGAFLSRTKPPLTLLVGQHARPELPDTRELRAHDLLISSVPSNVSHFAALGIPSALHGLGFEGRLIDEFPQELRSLPVTFVGSFFSVHGTRESFLEELCSLVPELQVWTDSLAGIPETSPIRKAWMGAAWGREMYGVLARSRITLNHHGHTGPFANNLRLFEATGMGALLITDAKDNLGDVFLPGEEVVDYHDVSECAELIRYYLDNEQERARIAAAGRMRTLRDHTWAVRMQQLLEILQPYVDGRTA